MLLRCALFSAWLGVALAAPAGAQMDHTAPNGATPNEAGGMHSAMPPATPGTAHQAPADEAMMAGMDKMARDMEAAPMTGNADHDFAAMMVPHHQGAIDMARAELRYGKDPTMRQLARDIVAAQEREIAMMRSWLAAGRSR